MAANRHASPDARLPKLGARRRFRWPVLIACAVLLTIFFLPGAGVYHQYASGKMCVLCHEVREPFQDWRSSTHRNVPCTDCHGSAFSLQARMHVRIIRELVVHLRGNIPEQVRLKTSEVLEMGTRCQTCHRQEYASWAAGPHGSTYAQIFLDKDHNRQRHLMDDCLRCHGMHFEGGIRDLVTPIDAKGPWKLRRPELADQPAIPCLACHQMHRQGLPEARPVVKPVNPGASQERFRPSLALFDRRELDFVPVGRLPLPAMREGDRPVKISPDQRQALCYQCHAPLADMEVGSGDDRTTIGVHEGLSCLACHQGHGQKTRASCANCHPHLSNCGLDVETMDTSFKSLKSPHNIHTVKCIDCHTKGVPKKKTASL